MEAMHFGRWRANACFEPIRRYCDAPTTQPVLPTLPEQGEGAKHNPENGHSELHTSRQYRAHTGVGIGCGSGGVLDKEDLAVVGAVLVRLVAGGTAVTPTMIPAILRRDPYPSPRWTGRHTAR